MTQRITTFGDLDQRSLDQLTRCAEAGDADYAVLCADHHPGYSQPIGGVVAYRDFISPSGVGYDIACGNKAVKTNLSLADGLPIAGLMDEIVRTVSFGIGRNSKTRVDDTVIDEIRDAPFAPQRRLAELAAGQLGTVGSGNHYVDLFADENGAVWIGVHFGSRGFGHKTASGFLALAQGLKFDEQVRDGEMDSPPILFPIDSELGQAYVAAMELAGKYAYAGRNAVVDTVLGILGGDAVEEIHNHHNFAWHETHEGNDYWVIRKGATPAFPGQRGFVGGSMGDISVILEGIDTEEAKSSLYSTVHGAGRVMSRTKAAGRWKKTVEERTDRRGNTTTVKRRVRSGGLIDWDATRRDLAARGIELRGAGADEAPGVYKRLPDVLGHHAGSVRVLHTLTPLGVAMAGDDTFDPYKD
jgi:tRNA-splicing ligase RtcB